MVYTTGIGLSFGLMPNGRYKSGRTGSGAIYGKGRAQLAKDEIDDPAFISQVTSPGYLSILHDRIRKTVQFPRSALMGAMPGESQ